MRPLCNTYIRHSGMSLAYIQVPAFYCIKLTYHIQAVLKILGNTDARHSLCISCCIHTCIQSIRNNVINVSNYMYLIMEQMNTSRPKRSPTSVYVSIFINIKVFFLRYCNERAQRN